MDTTEGKLNRPAFTYQAEVLRVVDGDTLDVFIRCVSIRKLLP